jgi:hypothetical protein
MDPGHRDYWFRSADWTPEARELFENKLRRVRRPSNRSQYLRIKALSLIESADPNIVDAGIMLLHRFLEEYPDAFDTPLVFKHLGDAYAKKGGTARAEQYYRQAVGAEEADGAMVRTGAPLDLAELLVASNDIEKNREAEDMLDRLEANPLQAIVLKADGFRFFLARARLAAKMGARRDASWYATQALKLALDRAPQFPRHPGVGDIDADPATLNELSELAEMV